MAALAFGPARCMHDKALERSRQRTLVNFSQPIASHLLRTDLLLFVAHKLCKYRTVLPPQGHIRRMVLDGDVPCMVSQQAPYQVGNTNATKRLAM